MPKASLSVAVDPIDAIQTLYHAYPLPARLKNGLYVARSGDDQDSAGITA
jgi:hypothetical protein